MSTSNNSNSQSADWELINGQEFKALILALGRGQGTFTDLEMGQVLDEMKRIKRNYIRMQMLFKNQGTLTVRPDGKVVVGESEGESLIDLGLRGDGPDSVEEARLRLDELRETNGMVRKVAK